MTECEKLVGPTMSL